MEFDQLTTKRHSGRAFDTERAVPMEFLERMVAIAHAAPSCYNDQPWRFLITDKEKTPQAHAAVAEALAEANKKWAEAVPVLIVVVAHDTFARNGKPNRWGSYDSGAAAISMVYEAANLGLMAHQMGGFDEALISRTFAIPKEYTPMAVMAVGYEAKEAPALSPKERNPVKEQFFWGKWGDPLPF